MSKEIVESIRRIGSPYITFIFPPTPLMPNGMKAKMGLN